MAEGTRLPTLNVLMCITPRHFSGAERVLVNLAAGLQQRGHRIRVLTKPEPQLIEELTRRQVEVLAGPLSGKVNLPAIRFIGDQAQEMQADLIYTVLSTASLLGGIAGRRSGLPVISHVCALNRAVWYRRATRLLACSEGVREHLVKQGVPEDNIEVVYNGVERALFEDCRDPGEVRAELGLSPQAPVLCCVAHLHPKKGHRYLIEAVARLRRAYPDLTLLCLGRDSGSEEALQQQVKRLGLEGAVSFLGFRHDALSVMQASDVVVLPSIATEGLGMALTEAAFLGKPTVGTDMPGLREALVNGETGLLASPGDDEALAAQLDLLLADAALRRQMGEAGRVWVERTFSLERQMELTEAALVRTVQTTSAGQQSL